MRAFGLSDTGLTRKINEDAFYFQEEYEKGKPFFHVIADGMGGHKAGEVASKMAVTQIVDFLKENINNCKDVPMDCISILREAFYKVNKNIYLASIKNIGYAGMGTTLIVSFIVDQVIIIGHVGDSRVYFIRNNSIKKVTTDHSYVAELVKKGKIRPEDACNHPQKNMITRAVGTGYTIDVDINKFEIEDGDYILMCTDGLSNMLEEKEILEIISKDQSLIEKCKELTIAANDKGGKDNITVIIIEVKRGGPSCDR